MYALKRLMDRVTEILSDWQNKCITEYSTPSNKKILCRRLLVDKGDNDGHMSKDFEYFYCGCLMYVGSSYVSKTMVTAESGSAVDRKKEIFWKSDGNYVAKKF
ncbi:hypothetical protein DPMN_004340 [Dreissena polymorpha]|uniref:Uncharacterized protein n=1 Tax=Dreissena polymorpha TaxID=45954 RepID=A0A9D4RSX0_DREPO|nr:hypothetical protein DPMN_004340 [Dreissena polymorpha]